VLKKSLIIYTTLSCASYSFFEKIPRKETLIMDEAAQAIEILTLAPIRSNCKKLIMIGDIQQLPATVFSQTSLDLNYDRSLFKRLQLKKLKIWFLETQYRMHPQISSFIARKFYRNGLKDSENVASIKNFQVLRGFGPMIFFDVCEGFDQLHLKQKNSWCNLDEIRLISLIIKTLLCLFSNLKTLVNLSIADNQLTSFDKEIFFYLFNLNYLNLSRNQIV
jgi:senataxin